MRAEILSVGTELLLGDTINTNAAYVAKELALLGISCYYQTVVGDNPERLRQTLELALSRSDMVIMSGGLGPTYDDLTKETVAKYFNREMQLHQPSYDMLVRLSKKTGRDFVNSNNKKQAMMPEGAIVFENDRGTANGLAVEGDGKIVIMLPGPPREITAMFQRQVRPYLEKMSDMILVSHNIHFFGIGESQLEGELHEYMLEHENPTVAPYAKEGEVLLRVTASAKNREQAEKILQPVIQEICEMYPKRIYGVDVDSLQNALVQVLKEKNQTIAVAESCTGGLVSKRLTEIDGASEVFGYGITSYSNQAKMDILGVGADTLEKYGAVSEQTAIEMARGARKISGADFGISTTGIAGSKGGSKEKPVGLVYIAISHKDGERAVELNLGRGYGGGREHIRYAASSNVLHLALKTVQPKIAIFDK